MIIIAWSSFPTCGVVLVGIIIIIIIIIIIGPTFTADALQAGQ